MAPMRSEKVVACTAVVAEAEAKRLANRLVLPPLLLPPLLLVVPLLLLLPMVMEDCGGGGGGGMYCRIPAGGFSGSARTKHEMRAKKVGSFS